MSIFDFFKNTPTERSATVVQIWMRIITLKRTDYVQTNSIERAACLDEV